MAQKQHWGGSFSQSICTTAYHKAFMSSILSPDWISWRGFCSWSVGSLCFSVENHPGLGQRPQRCHRQLQRCSSSIRAQSHHGLHQRWIRMFAQQPCGHKSCSMMWCLLRSRSHCWNRSLLLLMVIVERFYNHNEVLLRLLQNLLRSCMLNLFFWQLLTLAGQSWGFPEASDFRVPSMLKQGGSLELHVA